MNIGTLTIEMAANVGRLTTDMAQAKTVVGDAMKGMQAAVDATKTAFVALTGVASFAAFKSMIDGVIEAKVQLKHLSDMTGASVESLSAISAVAKMTGTNISDVGSAINKMQLSLAKNDENGKGAAQAIKALGLDFEKFKGLKADDQILQVAKAMGGFEDGAGKAATAMLLWGKSGAQLLPMMKDLADKNTLLGKTSTESALQAEEYEKNLRKLEAAGQSWRRELVDWLLPGMVSMTNQLIEGRKAFGGFWSAMVGIGLKSNPFASLADNAKTAADSVTRLQGQIAQLESGAGRTVSSAPGGAGFIFPNIGMGDTGRKLKAARDELDTAIKQKAYFDAMGADAANNYRMEGKNHPKPALAVVVPDKAGGGPKDDPSLKILEGQLKEQANYIAEEKKLLGAREQMLSYYQQQEYTTLRESETTKQGLMQDALGKELGFYDKEITAIRAYIAEKQKAGEKVATADGENRLADARKRRADAELEANGKLVKSQQDLLAVQRQFDLVTQEHARTDKIGNESAQFQLEMLGKNTLEVLQFTAARRIQLDLDQRIYQLKKADPMADTSGAIAQAAAQTTQATAQIAADYNKQRSAIFGADEALRKYIEDAGNQAGKMEQVFGNAFQGMEDALVQFASTGKLSFSSFATSVVADIDRMIIKQQLLVPLAEYLKAGSSGGTGFGGFLTSLFGGGAVGGAAGPQISSMGASSLIPGFASGGDPPVGRPYWVGEHGPELRIDRTPGTIVPASMVSAGGNRTVNVVNHFTLQAPTDTRTQNQIAVKAGLAIQQAMNRNG